LVLSSSSSLAPVITVKYWLRPAWSSTSRAIDSGFEVASATGHARGVQALEHARRRREDGGAQHAVA
jgi:hypothetical protein